LELRDWSKQGPARRKEAIEQIAAEAQRQLAAFDAETLEGLDVLGEAIRKARAELRSDEYDLKQWTSNRRRDATRGRPVKAAVRRKESAAELVSNIEANLESAEEWAWWRRQRPSILRTAKELGKTAGDEIAEMIRESKRTQSRRSTSLQPMQMHGSRPKSASRGLQHEGSNRSEVAAQARPWSAADQAHEPDPQQAHQGTD
jgi:hypothetical protein